MPGRTDDHRWLRRHLSHYAEATCGGVEGLSTYEAAEITGIGQAASAREWSSGDLTQSPTKSPDEHLRQLLRLPRLW